MPADPPAPSRSSSTASSASSTPSLSGSTHDRTPLSSTVSYSPNDSSTSSKAGQRIEGAGREVKGKLSGDEGEKERGKEQRKSAGMSKGQED
ncbi:hypothetical protein JCM8097_001916 [Rhodosporidiobolus ruineniae]